jgi:hypothetical protein
VDPDSLHPDPEKDPDPAFQVDPIRIKGFDDQKFRKNTEIFFSLSDQKLQFSYH